MLHPQNTLLYLFPDQSSSEFWDGSEDWLWSEERGLAQCPETAEHQVGCKAPFYFSFFSTLSVAVFEREEEVNWKARVQAYYFFIFID